MKEIFTFLLKRKVASNDFFIPPFFKSPKRGYRIYGGPETITPEIIAYIQPFIPDFSPRYLSTLSLVKYKLVKTIITKTIPSKGITFVDISKKFKKASLAKEKLKINVIT